MANQEEINQEKEKARVSLERFLEEKELDKNTLRELMSPSKYESFLTNLGLTDYFIDITKEVAKQPENKEKVQSLLIGAVETQKKVTLDLIEESIPQNKIIDLVKAKYLLVIQDYINSRYREGIKEFTKILEGKK